MRGPTSVLSWVRPRVPSNLPPATGIADDRRPNPRGLSILISNLQLPFSLVWELSKEVACALISRCSDYRRLTICVAAAIVIIIPPHSHMIDTLLGVTRRHGTCDPLADRATFVLLLVVPVFLCRGVQFVRLHCDVGRAWAWGCLALPGLEALLPKFYCPIRVPVMLVGF